jgi:hypothetical protein
LLSLLKKHLALELSEPARHVFELLLFLIGDTGEVILGSHCVDKDLGRMDSLLLVGVVGVVRLI